MKLLVTTNDLYRLIDISTNTDEEKENFIQKVVLDEVIEGVSVKGGLMLIFDNQTNIVLKDVTIENLFFTK